MPLLPAQPHDTPVLTRLLSLAFGTPPDKVGEWLTNSGLHNFRMYVEDRTPLACCLRIPMGHYFGGQSVPTVGVAGVAVAPETRGRGVASDMMAALLEEIRTEGCPLSSLYPATLPLYRRGGYEQAGSWCEHRHPLSRLQPDPSLLPIHTKSVMTIRAYDAQRDLIAVKHCYAEYARTTSGYLDRGDYVWGRVFHPRVGPATGFMVENRQGEPEGYVFLRHEKLPTNHYDVHLTDIAFTTVRAARRLIDFLRDFQSMGEDLVFHAGPTHPLTNLLSERKFKVTLKEIWLLRITDVAQALEARGYNPHVTAAFTLHISDDVLSANSGHWHVAIKDGRAAATQPSSAPASTPTLSMDTRALASMYSGFLSPADLSALGRLSASDDAALGAAAAAFAGPSPSLPDIF